MRVLVVDDSVVFRSQIKAALEGVPGIEVAGTANNGRIALQKLAQSSVDLITLDMEMPELSGLETIQEIKRLKYSVRIIVFSSHTVRGSEAALDALKAGADDFVAKPVGDAATGIEGAAARIRADLIPKVRQFLPAGVSVGAPAAEASRLLVKPVSAPKASYPARDIDTFRPSVLLIGSSTGGPPALEKVLTGLAAPFRLPILIAQHMPPFFTASLAKRLQDASGIPAGEAVDGEEIQPGRIYVAPGDYHFVLKKSGNQIFTSLNQNPQRNSVRPAVDYLFESAAEIYGHRAMAFVLTGMGEDGLVGCRAIKEKGGGVMIQDKASCVVFGMPGAVFQEGIQDRMGNLSEIRAILARMGA